MRSHGLVVGFAALLALAGAVRGEDPSRAPDCSPAEVRKVPVAPGDVESLARDVAALRARVEKLERQLAERYPTPAKGEARDGKAAPSATVVWRSLGVRVKPVGADAVAEASKNLHGGLLVEKVRPDGVADRAGIRRGDILVGLHQWEMLTTDNVVFVLTHPDQANFDPLRFYLVRAGQVHRGFLPAAD